VYADALDLDTIRVSAEDLTNDIIFGLQDWARGRTDSRAFTTMTLINFDVDDGITPATLIHELCHVWQAVVDGPFYLVQAIHAQNTSASYNYGYTNAANGDGGEDDLLAANGDFESFNREQQGQIMMHYFVRRYQEARPTPQWQPYVDFVQGHPA
jgi:hypothetical protein